MEALGLPSSNFDLVVYVDATRKGPGPIVVYDGPIESVLVAPGAHFYGRVWTGGPRVVIRYYSARLPDGQVIPFCAVAADDDGLGLSKSPGRPGSAAVYSRAFVTITGRFR